MISLPIRVTLDLVGLFATGEGYVHAEQTEEKNEPTSCNKELMNTIGQF